MTQIYKYLFSDLSKNSTFKLRNLANNSIFASVFDSILDSRSRNSTSIFQFCDSVSTLLRLQSFDIRLNDKPRVETPLRRYLLCAKSRSPILNFTIGQMCCIFLNREPVLRISFTGWNMLFKIFGLFYLILLRKRVKMRPKHAEKLLCTISPQYWCMMGVIFWR